jgi:outer membrane immunogenic protein
MSKMLSLAAAAAVSLAGAASAADIPQSNYFAPRPVSSAFNWAGAYAGVNAGYQWGETDNNPTNPSGLAGGVQFGYNWQNGQFVFGGETDLQISGADDTFAPWKFSNPWFGTLRGRAGYAIDNFLLYATLGLAYGGIRGEIIGLSESKTHAGWTAGAGVEVGLNKVWSAKAEYLYMELNNRLYTVTGMNNGIDSNLFRFGVNYHF